MFFSARPENNMKKYSWGALRDLRGENILTRL